MRLDDIDVRAPNRTLDAATVAEVRAETAAILDRASIARGGSPAGRVRVRVELVERRDYASEALQQDGFAIFGLWPVIVGMVSEREKLSVDVTIDDAGRTLEGHGTSEKLGGLYAPARRRALAVALDTALADAAR